MLGEAIKSTVRELDDASTAALTGRATEAYLVQIDDAFRTGRGLQAKILSQAPDQDRC